MKPIFNKIPEEYLDTYYGYFDLVELQKKYRQKKKGFHMLYAREHPASFAYFLLGVKLRPYQVFAIDKILQNPETALDWARRLGKSTICGLLAFWMTYFNKYPKNAIEKFTVVGIVSKEAEASKKILRAIRDLIDLGDKRWDKLTTNQPQHCRDFFTRQLTEPNNSEQLTWSNKCTIHSLPPTKKVKGWGFSYLFIDEIAYLDPKDEDASNFFNLTCRPTLADCGGKLVIASTPCGRSGLFYELFDPDDKFETNMVRLWFNWEINKDEEIYCTWVKNEKGRLFREGKEATYRQEFMGDFTVIQNNFFEPEDVETFFDNSMTAHYEWTKSPCSIGIDFGISDCLTVVTVKTKYLGKILTLYQRAFPRGFDNNELMNRFNDDSIPRLFKRYNVNWLVPEESSVSDMFVKWCKREGLPVYAYRFVGGNQGSKNKAFHTYRAMLKKGDLKCYPIPLLKQEMANLQEKQEKINWIISKPPGGTDDAIDSDVFATTPFFEDEGSGWHGFGEEPKNKEEEKKEFDVTTRNPRVDNMRSNMLYGEGNAGYIKSPF